MPRSQLTVILALALLCGLAAGTFVYFMMAAPPEAARPAPVEPVHVASPSPAPSTVMLPTQAPEPVPVVQVDRGSSTTKMKPPTQTAQPQTQPQTQTQTQTPTPTQGPRSAASIEQRVHHARRQCHEMAERLCRCYPQTCAQQRQAHRDADRSVANAARNLERMPDALNQMLQQLEQSCRETWDAMRRSMPQCFSS